MTTAATPGGPVDERDDRPRGAYRSPLSVVFLALAVLVGAIAALEWRESRPIDPVPLDSALQMIREQRVEHARLEPGRVILTLRAEGGAVVHDAPLSGPEDLERVRVELRDHGVLHELRPRQDSPGSASVRLALVAAACLAVGLVLRRRRSSVVPDRGREHD